MTMAVTHRLIGLVIAVFLVAHLGNHALVWQGATAHSAVLDTTRALYRIPIVEMLLIAGFIVQLSLGIRLLLRRGRPASVWAWVQVVSGGYLAIFLIQHVPAVFYGRFVQDLDTNIYFAAATVHCAPAAIYFAPYYVLAVTAVFAHLAAALRFAIWPRPVPLAWALPVIGSALGIWIVAGMANLTVPVEYLGKN